MIKIYGILFLLLFFPVLEISGHFISVPEFFLYVATLFSLKSFKKHTLVPSYLFYLVGFFFVALTTSLLAQTSLNNHDLFTLRNCAQSICAFFLFDLWFRRASEDRTKEQLHQFIVMLIVVATLPILLVFFQRIDLFNLREVVMLLYKPQFHFLGEEQFSSYRYTSVFKDFFTFACYSIILSLTQLYALLKLQLLGKARLLLFSLLLLTYLAQFYVARTSVVFIPIFCAVLFWRFPSAQLHGGVQRKLLLVFLLLPIMTVGVFALFYFKLINAEWVQAGVSTFALNADTDSSLQVMQEWNIGFFNYLLQNPLMLLIPKHSYDLTVTANPALYTDSFYAQEIYRYGIYGLLLYLGFVIWLWRAAKRIDLAVALFVLMAVILNYKGGNVFFMHKNSYLYPIFITIVLWSKRWDSYLPLNQRNSGDNA